MRVIHPQLWTVVHLNEREVAVPNEAQELWAVLAHPGLLHRSPTAQIVVLDALSWQCPPLPLDPDLKQGNSSFPHVHWRNGGKRIMLSKVLHLMWSCDVPLPFLLKTSKSQKHWTEVVLYMWSEEFSIVTWLTLPLEGRKGYFLCLWQRKHSAFS